MRHLKLPQILRAHRRIIAQSGGSTGIRDHGALLSALAQPRMSFGGSDLYPTVEEKAAALGFSLIRNHPFVDGNKRVGHAAVVAFLRYAGFAIDATVDEQERIILELAASQIGRDGFLDWLRSHIVPRRR